MIKNRSFWIGLGTGLVFGALLLQLMISAGMSTPSKSQIIQEAARQNLKVSDASEKLMTEEEWKTQSDVDGSPRPENTQEAAEAGTAPQPTATPAPSSTTAPSAQGTKSSLQGAAPSAPVQASSPSAPSKPSTPAKKPASSAAAPTKAVAPSAPAASNPASANIILRIPSGVTLSQVADLLAGAGVIKDKDAFLIAAGNRQIQRRIQYGLYNFKPGQSLDSIIEQLITIKE
ncbi:endolytic transglycosylase MltG [Paenibacillus sp. HN-1]|uniref:endolytic transglycosylase MltG n=1 Tax=Paenibacillus TaxID=44249 RepID=UPI001CA7C7F6|nr:MULTISPECIES: endolytic transglycosylase MltG [Paenibacillus]MBY9081914.1 endolytic transglycosylase MltG [Paenibacillus sp. CGMCC 1.18879]MBY9085928.1 endolytic transglycosylase MltG [Paenibacillus sinensis]